MLEIVNEDAREQYYRGVDIIERKIKEFVSQGSGWSVEEMVKQDLHVAPYELLRAASYIPTDTWLAAKKAIISVKNDDGKCFVWSVLAGLHPQKLHANRVSKYVQWISDIQHRTYSRNDVRCMQTSLHIFCGAQMHRFRYELYRQHVYQNKSFKDDIVKLRLR